MSFEHLKNVFTTYQLSDYMGAPSLRRWLVAAIKSWQGSLPDQRGPHLCLAWNPWYDTLLAYEGVLTVYEMGAR